MRRLIIEEPFSDAALVSRRLAVFAFAVALIGVVAARGDLDPPAAVAVLYGAAAVAALSILCAVLAFVIIWRTGRTGAGAAFAGLILSLLLLAYPAYLAARTSRLPNLIDLSTDLVDPPQFSLSRQAQAARGGVAPPDAAKALRARQAQAFPQIQPILLDLNGREAYAAILKAVAASGWRVVDQTPPGGRSGIGHVDAIARGLVLGFPVDVAVRIRPLAGQTRVDARAVSRFGRYDFGASLSALQTFETALEAQVDKK